MEKRDNFFDICIVGGGPAGLTAAIYCARAGKSVALFEKEACGGRITQSPDVRNIPGFIKISGQDFGEQLMLQAEAYGVQIFYEEITSWECQGNEYGLKSDFDYYLCKAIILATGTKNRLLGVENEDQLIGNGISFCVTCDGALYSGKDVAVIGGGNSAVTEALELSNICKSVNIIQNLPELTAEQSLVDELNKRDNVTVKTNLKVVQFIENYVDNQRLIQVTCIDERTKDILINNFSGVFLAIGVIPQTDTWSNLVELSDYNYIQTDSRFYTETPGVFACGDCVEGNTQQVSVACGSGTVAALSAIKYLETYNS